VLEPRRSASPWENLDREWTQPPEESGTVRTWGMNDTRYAVPDPEGHIAASRAEDSIFFHKKFALFANFL
jgi:hypothetical protein